MALLPGGIRRAAERGRSDSEDAGDEENVPAQEGSGNNTQRRRRKLE
jgi:hypothetical protein